MTMADGDYEAALQLVCQIYSLNIDEFRSPLNYPALNYKAENAYFLENPSDVIAKNSVSALKVTPILRFGNGIYQLIHALHLAMKFKIPAIVLGESSFLNPSGDVSVDGLRLLGASSAADQFSGQGQLAGLFFFWGRLSEGYAPDGTLKRAMALSYLRPMMNPRLLSPVIHLTKTDIVCHFRSGDLFDDNAIVNKKTRSRYGQPPLAFYVKAVRHARSATPNARVIVVFEDKANPCVAELEQWLTDNAIPFMSISSSLEEDLSILISARRLIASYGTFVFGAALLSKDLEELYWYDDNQWAMQLSKLSHLTSFRIIDRAGGFLKRGEWLNSESNRRLLIEYPESALEFETRQAS